MGEILTGKRNRKTKKMVGVLIGLSLVQTGTVLVPGGNLTMTVYAGDEMTTEEYAQAAAEALAQLSAGADKSALNDLVSKAQNLDTSSSDDASVAQLQAIIAAAVQVCSNESASQSMVDKHIQFLEAAGNALYQKTDANTVYDGVYEISGSLQHASADQVSMGNAALVKPFQLIKDGDSLKLRIECTPLTTKLGSTSFTGYLAEFWYFPDWTDDVLPPSAYATQSVAAEVPAEPAAEEGGETAEDVTVEEDAAEDAGESTDGAADDGEELFSDSGDASVVYDTQEEVALYAGNVGGIAATVESSYENTYDSYNDPKKGTDANVKGKLYPHYIQIPIDLNRTLLWTQVYVPVMEAIGGGGRQYARLVLDWSSLKQISGTVTDKSALVSGISEAETLLANLNKDNQGYAAEQIQALSSVITAAKAVNTNINVDQEIVNSEVNVLTKAVNVFTKTVVDSDKSELRKALEVADSYLKADDVTYEESTLATLQTARDQSQLIYDDEEATQTQVNLCVTAIDNAIQGLTIVGGDRRELKKAIAAAAEILEDEDSYKASDYNKLKSKYDEAKAVLENEDAEQAVIDKAAKNLNSAISSMKKVSELTVDKESLYEMLKTAQNMSGRESLYTEASIKMLKSAITAADKVYKNAEATQSEVNAQTSALSTAITNLEKQVSSNSNSSNNNNNSSNTTTSSELDINNLADGVYSITGSMVKIDKTTASMSNEAINHTIKLTVKNGKYSLTMDFKGMTINSQYGYLGKLNYYKTGYSVDKYGSPQGSLGSVTINSYQKTSNGKKVSDNFGTNYPDVVTFPMISEALKDGYVPLQVFVPIMDSISKGSGTQPVYLKLDWSTIKKTTSNDSAFKDTSTNDNSGSTGTTTGTTTTGSLQNTLKTGSTLGTNSSLTTNSKLGTSSLGTSSLKTSGSSSLSKTGTTSLTGSKNLKSTKKSGDTSTTSLKSTAAGLSADGTSASGSGTATAKESSKKSAEDVGKVVIPSVLSSLAALAGIFYKLKSRLGIK